MNNVKIIVTLIFKILTQTLLIITYNLITQMSLILISNEEIKGEKFDQEQSSWFWNQAKLHLLLAEDKFSWHTLSLMN
jgi:hypothetical protein